MNENPTISQEELDREYEWMESRGKHSYNHRMINRQMRWRKIAFIALIVFIIISILAILFVLIFRSVEDTRINAKAGDYEIILEDKSKSFHLRFADGKQNYDILLGAGAAHESTGDSLVETTLLGTAGAGSDANQFASFLRIVSGEIEVKDAPEDTMGTEFGVQYFDSEDRSYISFYQSYYSNRFIIENSGDSMKNYSITYTFIKGNNDCHKAARLIIAEKKNGEISYSAYAVQKDDGTDEVVCNTNITFIKGQGNGVYFLLDPNIKTDTKDYSKGASGYSLVDKSLPRGTVVFAKDVAPCEDTWMANSMVETKEGEYSFTVDNLELDANSEVEYIFLLYFEASDPDHSTKIANGSMGFSVKIVTETEE